jgi:hypothetical protein
MKTVYDSTRPSTNLADGFLFSVNKTKKERSLGENLNTAIALHPRCNQAQQLFGAEAKNWLILGQACKQP